MSKSRKLLHRTGRRFTVNVDVIQDIIVFVPGTTNPFNATPAEIRANHSYWNENKKAISKITSKVKEIKGEYKYLHVLDEFYSWSGDNNKGEREKAGKELLEFLKKFYSGLLSQPVSLHLIGHSHGGNVINEFTKYISLSGEMPPKWRIKSITYLSTPFFETMHQLDVTCLSQDTIIINVKNEFDLTQRIIANYSLRQLPNIVKFFERNDNVLESWAALKAFGASKDKENIFLLKSITGSLNDNSEGPMVWSSTTKLLKLLRRFLFGIYTSFQEIRNDFPDVFPLRASYEIENILRELLNWINQPIRSFELRKENYDRSTFRHDLNILPVLRLLNNVLEFHKGRLNSKLIIVLTDFLFSRIDRFELTKTEPKQQLGSHNLYKFFEVEDKADIYGERSNSKNFSRFVSKLERLHKKYEVTKEIEVLREVLIYLVAQNDVTYLIYAIFAIEFLEFIFWGKEDDELIKLKNTLKNYLMLFMREHEYLEDPSDLNNFSSAEKRPGNIMYLLKTSHNITRFKLHEQAINVLIKSIDSRRW